MVEKDIVDRVLSQVDEQEIVELASDLIRIPSFKPDETPVANFLADFFRPRGYEVDMQEVEPGRFQAIATLRGTGGGNSLMLNGHTDINSLGRRWTRDPWTPTVEGDRLYGQGVQNMKGGLASIIMAAEAIRLSGVRLKGDLVVACVVGETQGGEGTYHLMQSGLRTDMAVVAEPFGLGNLATVHADRPHGDPHLRRHRSYPSDRGHGQCRPQDDQNHRRIAERRVPTRSQRRYATAAQAQCWQHHRRHWKRLRSGRASLHSGHLHHHG